MAVAKETFGLWSPHRNSKSVQAFRSLLNLRPERWIWLDQAQRASWWVVDGSCEIGPELTSALNHERTTSQTRGVILAPSWSAVLHPEWTFFKMPLRVSQVYSWIDATCKTHTKASLSFAGQHLRLLRWPNMTRYAQTSSVSDGIQLTAACAKLVTNTTRYEDVLAMVPSGLVLDAILNDALHEGYLELNQMATLVNPSPVVKERNPASDTGGTWSLVRRLIQKFR